MPTLKEAVWKVLAELSHMGLRQIQEEWKKAIKEFKGDYNTAAEKIWKEKKWEDIGYPRVPMAFFKEKLEVQKNPSMKVDTEEFPSNFVRELKTYMMSDVPKEVNPKGVPTRAEADPSMLKNLDMNEIHDEYSKKMESGNVPRVEILYNIVNKAIIKEDYKRMLKSLTLGGEGETALTKSIPKKRSVFASYDRKEAAYRVIKAYTANIG